MCNVSGAPKPSVSWTQVSTGKKRYNTTWMLTNFQESDAGEYRCDASNIYGNDSKSIFISLDGECNIYYKGNFYCNWLKCFVTVSL